MTGISTILSMVAVVVSLFTLWKSRGTGLVTAAVPLSSSLHLVDSSVILTNVLHHFALPPQVKGTFATNTTALISVQDHLPFTLVQAIIVLTLVLILYIGAVSLGICAGHSNMSTPWEQYRLQSVLKFTVPRTASYFPSYRYANHQQLWQFMVASFPLQLYSVMLLALLA
jgi:hypothetical protein